MDKHPNFIIILADDMGYGDLMAKTNSLVRKDILC